MPNVWITQHKRDIKKYGEEAAPWVVGWYDPAGKQRTKKCGTGFKGKKNAEKLKQRIETQLVTGTYQTETRHTWTEFVEKYDSTVLGRLEPRTRNESLNALSHFARIVKPLKMCTITTEHIDQYAAARSKEPGKKHGETVAVATVNKELRHLRAAFRKARKWGWITTALDFELRRPPKRLPSWMTGEHFGLIYGACEKATMPEENPAAWWRALLVFGYLTGWRISELLALRRGALDLTEGTALTEAEDNKGDRDARVKLHPVIVEHLRALGTDSDPVLFWPHHRRTLDIHFHRIQQAAGICLPCRKSHEHTPACHLYGFHDLRRAFATMNASRLTADQLQELMRHKSYQTTKVYIDMRPQVADLTDRLHLPEILRPPE